MTSYDYSIRNQFFQVFHDSLLSLWPTALEKDETCTTLRSSHSSGVAWAQRLSLESGGAGERLTSDFAPCRDDAAHLFASGAKGSPKIDTSAKFDGETQCLF